MRYFALVVVLAFFISCHRVLEEKPNIVLIYADDLGWMDVGYQGAEIYETPHIDRLASEGMIFNRFYPSAANCAPSRAGMLTGMVGPRHHVYLPQGLSRGGDIDQMRWKVPTRNADPSFNTFRVNINHVAPEFESLAEMLARAGYRSARIGKWHIGDDNQGFDVVSAAGEKGQVTNINGTEGRYYSDTLVAERMTDLAIDFIRSHKGRPFFVYLAHWEVHGPMAASKDRIAYFDHKIKAGKAEGFSPVYAAEIEQLDISVGRVVASLEAEGIADRTVVIFTSDNGGVSRYTSNRPLRAGKGTFYEGGIRTPMCIKWPGVVKPGSTSDVPVTGIDFMPTFAAMAGASLPDQQPVDGRSIVPLLKDQSFDVDRPLFFHFPLYLGGGGADQVLPTYTGVPDYWRAVPLSVIMKHQWKLIYYYEYDRYELYNLEHDISESVDLSVTHRSMAEQLLGELQSWVRAVEAPVPAVLNDAR
jgi:arylsulfatase A-like enzyme